MPRIFAKVNAGIWGDPDFRALPPAAQHLYLTLWTSPDLSFCGTHDWRPARLTGLSVGWTTDHVRTIADCLHARHFFVIDDATEEVLIRSWARFDETVKQPRLAVSYVNAYASTSSASIRAVLVHETQKMRDLWPDLACWQDQRVSEVLSHPSVSAKDLPCPEDPFGDGVGSALALGLPQTQGKVWGSVSVPPTTTTTTTTSNSTAEDAPGKPGRRPHQLPEDFKPNATNRRIAEERGLDIDEVLAQFADHHRAKGSTMKDWHLAFNTWLRRERTKPQPAMAPLRALPSVHDLEEPPAGLSDAEISQWYRDQRAKRGKA